VENEYENNLLDEVEDAIRDYQNTNNPLYLFEAWRLARVTGSEQYTMDIMFDYLDGISQEFITLALRDVEGERARNEVWDIMGFRRLGPRTPFSSYFLEYKARDTVYGVYFELEKRYSEAQKNQVIEELFPNSDEIEFSAIGKDEVIKEYVARQNNISVKTLESWKARVKASRTHL
jgi:hypothetical protein